MKSKRLLRLFVCSLCVVLVLSTIAYAHPGRTDSQGGHWNRKTGTYHYHNGGNSSSSTSSSSYTFEIPDSIKKELNQKEKDFKDREEELISWYESLIEETKILGNQYEIYRQKITEYYKATGRLTLIDTAKYMNIPKSSSISSYYNILLDKDRDINHDYQSVWKLELEFWEEDLNDFEEKLSEYQQNLTEVKRQLKSNIAELDKLIAELNKPTPTPSSTPISTANLAVAQIPIVKADELTIHFIDVGQADCILIQTASGKNMLIDAGNNADSQTILTYLRDKKVNTIDVLVGTHPHEDHIGSLDEVIRNIDVKSIYMPEVTANTDAFLSVLQAIKDKGLKISTPIPWSKVNLDNQVDITVLAPNSDKYEDTNDYSVVLKIVYKNTSFLLTGDAEAISEAEMLKRGFNLKADVLKVGHHGSSNSTTAAFLKVVSPQHAIISVGKDNSYGHPAVDTLQRIAANNTVIYRTDEVGTIIVTSDGNAVKVDKKASSIKPHAPPPSTISSGTSDGKVYITKTGTKYHNNGCRYLSQSKIEMDIEAAVASGYTACSVCKPQVLNGNSITNKAPPQTEQKEVTVYITKTGAKYHNAGCRYLSKSMIPISLKSAKSSGYTPCSVCGPPR